MDKDNIRFDLTTFFPEYKLGVNDLKDYLPSVQRDFSDLANRIELNVNDRRGEGWVPHEFKEYEVGDWYGKVDLDEE